MVAEIGDIVSYNVGGMVKHSLGIVIDKKVIRNLTFYRIAWQRLGKYKPKIAKRHTYCNEYSRSDEWCLFLTSGWSGTNVNNRAEINHPEWFEATKYDCFPKIKMNKS